MNDRTKIVTSVCTAFRTWGEVTGENRWPTEFEAIKSNLLYRLIYLGERLRTEKCPVHDGHWVGCAFGTYCDCQKVIDPEDGLVYYDSNVCGWLLDGNPDITGKCGSRGRVQADGSPLEYEPYDGYKSGRRAVTRDDDIWVTCDKLSGHKGPCDDGHDWNK